MARCRWHRRAPVASEPRLRRDGDTLALSGVLDRAAATALWPAALPLLAGARALDLREVSRVDSAGLALLAELAARLHAQGQAEVALHGAPAGLTDLSAAYRLAPTLDFQSPPAAS
ncbi:STAS domain-containing protein [Xanthomonas translucens pv. translucens]|uniref:Anti-sigma B factor antagonist n=3 Tax=Xanthomonas campestris pv. translucens TaxID=343 RepID=A0A120EXC3_XANCT|nr:STAS domain-containing protein [Xanthomonas translucens]KWV14209.1 anti-sigma B factor antagonist [Xanthomonas translucens]QSQ33451.1 STAS domain-containing protein [Xanthomonas translucens pv. translucens]QSQ45631.1 STAS domain-containing protein [Xanthomonas translucens pv. translucens]